MKAYLIQKFEQYRSQTRQCLHPRLCIKKQYSKFVILGLGINKKVH
jgi:hypothetical protein